MNAIGKHIVLKLNRTVTVDYTEQDEAIGQTGLIGLQLHSGPALEARFRNVRVQQRYGPVVPGWGGRPGRSDSSQRAYRFAILPMRGRPYSSPCHAL